MNSLYKKLVEHGKKGYYPMHMPGHKRNTKMLPMDNPYGMDITEIEGFDDLHDPKEILKTSMERAGKLYHSKHTEYLINGSTVGILAGILGSTKKGDKIIMARNCHKSVYNAVFLGELNPVYVYPQFIGNRGINGGISPQKIESLLINNPDVKLIVITSPTYEGIVSDIEKIAEIAHSYNIPCLIDEAHGAHFGFDINFPKSSVECDADIVIHSLHKTLPSFTQTALMHINSSIVNYDIIKEYLKIYQSSSPSYILMAGIDQCIEILENQREELFNNFYKRLSLFYDNMKCLKYIEICSFNKESNFHKEDLCIYDSDPSKIIISVNNSNITGLELYHLLLSEYKIQVEMAAKDYVIAITTICDTEAGFRRLEDALMKIDNELSFIENNKNYHITENIMIFTSYETFYKEKEEILLQESVDRISKEYIYLYPPGIPLIVPGEIISKEFIHDILEYKESGFTLRGFIDQDLNYISVVK